MPHELDASDLLGRLSRAISRINELESAIAFLSPEFIKAMNDLGKYGDSKYGELPRYRFQHSCPPRVSKESIALHSLEHFLAYINDVRHDHFHTRRHQLAAVAFNAMLEFHFAGLDTEP